MWLLRRMKILKLDHRTILDYYIKEIRSLVEDSGMPVWNSGLTKGQVKDLEKIQKVGLRIILGSEYKDYDSACQSLNIEPLTERRLEICTKFALKLYKSENAQQIYTFPSKSHCSPLYPNYYDLKSFESS